MGLAIYLCLTVRTVAIVLPVTLVLSDFLVQKKLRVPVICIPAITIVFLLGVQYFFIGTGAGAYNYVMKYRFFTPIENLQQFYWSLTIPFANTRVPTWLVNLLVVGLAIPVAVAVVYEAYKGTVFATFLISYTALLLVLPNFNAGARYLLPHLLFFGALAVRGTAILSKFVYYGRMPFRFASIGTAAVIVIFVTFIPLPLPFGQWDFGVTSASARELFSFVQNTTPRESVVAGSKTRSLHLFTGRITIQFPAHSNDLTNWLRSYSVSYVVIKHSEPKHRYDFTNCPEFPFCQGDFALYGAELIFRNSDFAVFSMETLHRIPATRSEASALR